MLNNYTTIDNIERLKYEYYLRTHEKPIGIIVHPVTLVDITKQLFFIKCTPSELLDLSIPLKLMIFGIEVFRSEDLEIGKFMFC